MKRPMRLLTHHIAGLEGRGVGACTKVGGTGGVEESGNRIPVPTAITQVDRALSATILVPSAPTPNPRSSIIPNATACATVHPAPYFSPHPTSRQLSSVSTASRPLRLLVVHDSQLNDDREGEAQPRHLGRSAGCPRLAPHAASAPPTHLASTYRTGATKAIRAMGYAGQIYGLTATYCDRRAGTEKSGWHTFVFLVYFASEWRTTRI
jgi:hypothetical protein